MPLTEVGDLFRISNLSNTFPKGDTTIWHFKEYAKSKAIEGSIPNYY